MSLPVHDLAKLDDLEDERRAMQQKRRLLGLSPQEEHRLETVLAEIDEIESLAEDISFLEAFDKAIDDLEKRIRAAQETRKPPPD